VKAWDVLSFMNNFVGRLLFAFSMLVMMAGLIWSAAHQYFPIL
jgi:hypothetical protein